MKNYFYFPLTVLLYLPFLSFSQTSNINQEMYVFFDEAVGVENTGIYNGTEYKEKYRLANERHAYFNAQNFTNGSVNYNGELYFNLNIRYNLHEQEVILKIKNRDSSNLIINLLRDKVNSFTIDSHHFVKISELDSNDENIVGFYEVPYENPIFSLFIKHQKNKKDFYKNGFMYVEFIDVKNKYVILFEGNYIQINSKKDIIHLFPNFKKRINNFYKTKKSIRRLNYSQFLVELLQEIKLTK